MDTTTIILISIAATVVILILGFIGASLIKNTNKVLNKVGWVIKMMVSNDDRVSSKRIIALIAFLLMAISYSYGIITDTKIPEYMWEGFLFIVLSAFFGNVVEKFRNRGKQNDIDY